MKRTVLACIALLRAGRTRASERFEEKEHALFGKDGFEGVVAQVAGIEEQLGIANLSAFTPS